MSEILDLPFLKDVRTRPVIVEQVHPELDGGRFAVKREAGDVMAVDATVYKEGHDRISAVLKVRRAGGNAWREIPMEMVNPGLDLWRGHVTLDALGVWEYTVEAWSDVWGTWCGEVEKKIDAGQDVALELIEGRALLNDALGRVEGADGRWLDDVCKRFDAAAGEERAALLLSSDLRALMARCPDRADASTYDRVLRVVVERVQARYAAWYEMTPRSQSDDPKRHGTFKDVERRLAEVQAMGFDVLYFTPIHPIGRQHRKGPNNTLGAGSDDPGSPYAIGGEEGGHTAIHPQLGTVDDFRALVKKAAEHGMEIALDIAIQCSPDHPWIKDHPDWFRFRPDGTIKHAENPPKKYQDIVNVNFYGGHQQALWQELRDMFLYWCEEGVKTFRVDNPHTKPVPFWEWVIAEVRERHPDVIFLSEAFTRPPMLKMLAKVGFSQSYTYFTWRNFKHELMDYVGDLVQGEAREYLRPNLFPSTPDILPEFLQRGGPPAFKIRLALAATLSSVYGMVNGFELCEGEGVPGKEEYLDSEKYEIRVRNWDAPGNIKDFVTTLNRIRRDNPALHEMENLRFYDADDDNVIFYGKRSFAGDNIIFVAVNLDPFESHKAELTFPIAELGIGSEDAFSVEELFSGVRRLWRGAVHPVRLDPAKNPVAIYRLTRWKTVDYRSPCY